MADEVPMSTALVRVADIPGNGAAWAPGQNVMDAQYTVKAGGSRPPASGLPVQKINTQPPAQVHFGHIVGYGSGSPVPKAYAPRPTGAELEALKAREAIEKAKAESKRAELEAERLREAERARIEAERRAAELKAKAESGRGFLQKGVAALEDEFNAACTEFGIGAEERARLRAGAGFSGLCEEAKTHHDGFAAHVTKPYADSMCFARVENTMAGGLISRLRAQRSMQEAFGALSHLHF